MAERSPVPPAPLAGPVTMGEFRARLAEMADRVLAGEEIVVLRGSEPVARFVPCEPPRRRRSGVLRELIGEATSRELRTVLDEPLSERDQRVLEGEGTDDAGVWIGLPEDRFGGPQSDGSESSGRSS